MGLVEIRERRLAEREKKLDARRENLDESEYQAAVRSADEGVEVDYEWAVEDDDAEIQWSGDGYTDEY